MRTGARARTTADGLKADGNDIEPTVIDRARFAELYAEHRDALYAFCLIRTRDPHVAEDVVHDVFAKAFVHRSRFDVNRSFWPWLASIAARECIDVHRRRTYADARLPELAPNPTAGGDPTSDAVVNRLTGGRLEGVIATLPVRQRMALQLFAVDGWSHAEIAEHFGATVATVKMLIMRARRTVRNAGVRTLAGVACGTRNAWRRVHTAAARLTVGAVPWQGALRASFQEMWSPARTACLVIAVVAGMTLLPPPGHRQTSSAGGAPVARGHDGSLVDVRSGIDAGSTARSGWAPPPEPIGRAHVRAAEQAVHEAARPLLYQPSPHDSPEEAVSWSLAVSPSYDEDRTVFVSSGWSSLHQSRPLLVTRDGGASWAAPAAVGITNSIRVVLPPAYPQDPRVFGVGSNSVHVSHNGGEVFTTLFALPGINDLTVSPAFNEGDPTMLLAAGGQLFQYRDDTHRLVPFSLGEGLAHHQVISARYGHAYPLSSDLLVGTRSVDSDGIGLSFYRCRPEGPAGAATEPIAPARLLDCEGGRFEGSGSSPLGLRVPSRSRPEMVYATAGPSLYLSMDEGRTFRTVVSDPDSLVRDIEAIPSSDGMSAILAQYNRRYDQAQGAWVVGPSLLRTDDGGRTWKAMHVPLPRFQNGARAVAVTPTRRIIAVGEYSSIICSVDGGTTWAYLCPTPDTSRTG